MSAALGLYRLQQVDTQMDQIRARLNTIRETLENHAKLRAAKEAVSTSEAENRVSNSAVKASEAEVESQRIKIEHAESSLYGGQVKNPKELQDLQLEIASLTKVLSELDDKLLESLVMLDQAEEVVKLRENEVTQAVSQFETMKSRLTP